MKVVLKDIASIQMGYSFRTRLEPVDIGSVAVIQMKDLTEQNRVDCGALMRIDMDKPKEHHLVKPGDLIFRSRSLKFKSAILVDDPGIAVVAAPLFMIRVSGDVILPEYLNWFIGQAPAQAFLASHARGTVQKMISKKALDSLEVFVPSLERQKIIAEMASLEEKEQNILKRLAAKRAQYISANLIRLAQGA